MPYVYVDIDMDDLDTDELVDEVVKRFKSTNERKSLTIKQKELLRTEAKSLFNALSFTSDNCIPNKTLEDKMKIEIIQSVWDKYTLAQFEERLK